ncbi:hypothetical protein ElyMa_006508900 [Elysia marginata]|uniref:Uncharacterized protein n=1 Tax=Elysia marginata TaxID=1093978 RepID=A0AAV4I4T7_9GAST|nr:hypothetical protein ElyMa_006508900 [Elysia marginata]
MQESRACVDLPDDICRSSGHTTLSCDYVPGVLSSSKQRAAVYMYFAGQSFRSPAAGDFLGATGLGTLLGIVPYIPGLSVCVIAAVLCSSREIQGVLITHLPIMIKENRKYYI